jgi:hypothetical protein
LTPRPENRTTVEESYGICHDAVQHLWRARTRSFQAARRLRYAERAARQALAATDPDVQRVFLKESVRVAVAASDSLRLAALRTEGAIADLTEKLLDCDDDPAAAEETATR